MKKKQTGLKSKDNNDKLKDSEYSQVIEVETPEELTQAIAQLEIEEGHKTKEHDAVIPSKILNLPVSIKGTKNRLLSNLFKNKTFIANFQLRNGKHTTVLIRASKNYFKYLNGTYIIDDTLAYDNISSKFLMLDYHQDFCLPIQRNIIWHDIQDAIENSGIYEIENSTNPSALTKILEADIGGGVARASAMPDFIKQMRLLVIIAAVSSTVLLLLFMIKSGMLNSVKGSLGL